MGEPIKPPDSRNVCGKCFGDLGLKAFIDRFAEERSCHFCGRRSRKSIAAPLEKVLSYIRRCISHEYDLAVNILPYESAEGGWQYGTVWDTQDLMAYELGLDLPNDGGHDLFDTICEFLGEDQWCESDAFGLTQSQELLFGWREFCRYVTQQRRFFFREAWTPSTSAASQEEEMSPTQVLEAVMRHCGEGRAKEFKAGARFYRARFQLPGEHFEDAKTLGPPSAALAVKFNRMNPPGIPMMYLSEDAETALLETQREPGIYAIGEFELIQDTLLLDLAALPKIPSIFEDSPDKRHAAIFLHGFVHSITQPSAHDSLIHLDYIPTQVVTEYFRTVFNFDGHRIHGLFYPSVVNHGKTNLVLFATQADLEDGAEEDKLPSSDHPPWIRLVSHCVRTAR